MRVPDIVVATLAMTQQQIMSLLRTVENIHLARESRMLSAGTAAENRAWVIERMAFVAKKSIKTADDVYDAMLSRGFSGAMPSLVRLHAGDPRLGVARRQHRGVRAPPRRRQGVDAEMSAQFVLSGVRHEYRPGVLRPRRHRPDHRSRRARRARSARTAAASPRCSRCSTVSCSPPRAAITAFGHALTEDALEEPAFRREFRSQVGFVFQDADVQLFCATSFDELAFGPLQLGLAEDEVRRRVAEVAEQLRIEKLLDRAPVHAFRRREEARRDRQRADDASRDVLLMDEPTNALDPRSQVWLLDVLEEWKAAGRTVVIATHDLSARRGVLPSAWSCSPRSTASAPTARPTDVLAQRELLLEVNLIHEHSHSPPRVAVTSTPTHTATSIHEPSASTVLARQRPTRDVSTGTMRS